MKIAPDAGARDPKEGPVAFRSCVHVAEGLPIQLSREPDRMDQGHVASPNDASRNLPPLPNRVNSLRPIALIASE